MQIRQSDLKTWYQCPLKWRFQNIDGLPRLQNASATFGSVLHDCVFHLETTGDLQGTLDRFEKLWRDPELLGAEHRIDHYVKGTSWTRFAQEGPDIIRKWWKVIEWESDQVLAREFTFDVPIGSGHVLHGTLDKLAIRYRADIDSFVVQVVDYKTNRKVPKYDFLQEDIQFSAYSYATTRPELWEQLGRPEWYEQYRDLPRYGEWVQLTGPRRMDAGPRIERQYVRLAAAVDGVAESVAARIFIPNISGETCLYCDFRGPCGLPEREELTGGS
jgi:RecB family exonuclease